MFILEPRVFTSLSAHFAQALNRLKKQALLVSRVLRKKHRTCMRLSWISNLEDVERSPDRYLLFHSALLKLTFPLVRGRDYWSYIQLCGTGLDIYRHLLLIEII